MELNAKVKNAINRYNTDRTSFTVLTFTNDTGHVALVDDSSEECFLVPSSIWLGDASGSYDSLGRIATG